MSHTESFDRKTKKYTVILGLLMLGCSIFSVSSWAEPGFSDVASSGNGIATNGEQTPILPVQSSEIPTSTITVQMQGFADTPPPSSGGGSRAEVVTMPLSAPPPVVSAPDPAPVQTQPLRRIVEAPPPPPPVSPPPAVTMGTIAPVERPDSYSISSFGSVSSGSGVPAPQVYNGYKAPSSAFLQGGTNYQAPTPPAPQAQPQQRRSIRVTNNQQGISNTGAGQTAPPVQNGQFPTYEQQLSRAATLHNAGDDRGAEEIIKTFPGNKQAEARVFVYDGGASSVSRVRPNKGT